MARSIQELAIPRWTCRAVTDYSGRDPLGLSRVSQAITDYVLRGITTQTHRARYYSLYCWALWHIEHHEQPKRYDAYKSSMRRREAMIALSSLIVNPRTSVHGIQACEPKLAAGTERGVFDTNFKVLPSAEFGGYGNYYGGSLYALRLTETGEAGVEARVDRISNAVAESIACIVQSSLESTPYIKKRLFEKNEISLADLRRSAPYMTVDALSEPFARKERNALIDLFFSTAKSPTNDDDILRRHTLALILHIVLAYEDQSERAALDTIDWDLVFAPYYYDSLWLEDGSAAPYKYPSALEVSKGLWRQFCLQQFLTYAAESVMGALLEVVGVDAMGIPLEDAVAVLTQPKFVEHLEKSTKRACSTPAELLACFGARQVPSGAEARKARGQFGLNHRLSEWSALSEDADGSPQGELARGVLLLAVLYAKWRGEADDPAHRYVQRKAGSELSAWTLLPDLDAWLHSQSRWDECLHSLIERHVLDRHDRVMYEKRRLDASWVSRGDGRIRKNQDYGPGFRSSRHHNAVTILADLGLLRIDSDRYINSTPTGRKLLGRILVGGEWP